MAEKIPCATCESMILPATAEETGGLCMRCFKDPSRAEPTRIILRARANPARMLAPFQAIRDSPLARRTEPFEGSVAFQIGCSCGCSELQVIGHHTENQGLPGMPVFIAPLALRCQSCATATELFDPQRHGYDGESGSSAGMTGDGPSIAFACTNCSSTVFRPIVVLEYALDDGEMEEWPELAVRPQDFFTWFSLHGECSSCGQVILIADYECA